MLIRTKVPFEGNASAEASQDSRSRVIRPPIGRTGVVRQIRSAATCDTGK